MRLAILLAALLSLGAAPFRIPTGWQACQTDSECVHVAFGCCSCGGAGVSTAINRDFLPQYGGRYARFCAEDIAAGDGYVRCPQSWECEEGAQAFCNAKGRCEWGVKP